MSKTILIVDDEEFIRESLLDFFEMEDFNVLTAENGSVALSIIENQNVDFVISDIQMPESDGVWLLEQIRKKHPNLPAVIMVTGQADIDRDAAIKKGALDLLYKPPCLDQLLNKITNYFETK